MTDACQNRSGGQPCITWKDTIWRDIEPMDMVWDVVCLKAIDRDEWKEWTVRSASHSNAEGSLG